MPPLTLSLLLICVLLFPVLGTLLLLAASRSLSAAVDWLLTLEFHRPGHGTHCPPAAGR